MTIWVYSTQFQSGSNKQTFIEVWTRKPKSHESEYRSPMTDDFLYEFTPYKFIKNTFASPSLFHDSKMNVKIHRR